MCTVDDTDLDGEAFMPYEENLKLEKSSLCIKCKSEACLVLRKKDIYCRDCFLAYVDHKCRSSLGKSKQMKPNDKVLVGFSGSLSSMVLLHVLSTGKRQEDHKKLMYPIVFCHVDDGSVFKENLETRKKAVKKFKDIVESYGFEFYLSTLSKAITEDNPIVTDLDENELKMFQSLKSQTSKEDVLTKWRIRVLMKVAKELGCNKIFTAENQNSIAVKLLTKVALGVGEQLSHDVGFQDSRNKNVSILRPLCDIDAKAIAYYVEFNNLEKLQKPSWKTPNASIRKLTSDFIKGLQEEFPSTVSTIYKTGTKCSTDEPDNSEICLLCELAHTESKEAPYSAEDAMTFTKSVSQSKNCNQCSCSNYKHLKSSFCHSCLNIINDLESIEDLPSEVLNKLKERSCLDSMFKEIQDFLL